MSIKKIKITDDYAGKVTITEAEGEEVGGQAVLAKVAGPFFVPNGTSRNKRYYSSSLWEKQLARPEIQEKISQKRMYGTIGHKTPINDETLLEGKISHVVVDLAVEKDGTAGFGEALILDTPAGRILNTICRAEAGIFTSSRAMGKFSGAEHGGVPSVDEDTFDLETFDFVLDPGFLEANPALVESLNEMYDKDDVLVDSTKKEDIDTKPKTKLNDGTSESIKRGDFSMDTELVKQAMDEAATLRTDLSTAIDENKDLKAKLETASTELEATKGESEVLEQFKALGTVEEIKEKLAKLDTLPALEEKLAAYSKLGETADVEKALDVSIAKIREYREYGEPEKIGEALDKAKALLIEYRRLGSPSDIKTVIEKLGSLNKKYKSNQLSKTVESLSKELGQDIKAVRELADAGMNEEKIKGFFENIKPANDDSFNRFSKSKKTETEVVEEVVEDGVKMPWEKSSRASSIMEQLK